MNNKLFGQISHQEEGKVGRISIYVQREGKVWVSASFFVDREPRWKATTRQKDRIWVCKNIPSSIWWELEVHHDWNDNGRMYLLTHEEHKILERRIRNGKRENG